MNYQCQRCNKQFKDNYGLRRHQARKIPCPVTQQADNTTAQNVTINITINTLVDTEQIATTLNHVLGNYLTPEQRDDIVDEIVAHIGSQ